MSKYRVLDLFSGIGGFSLGLERTGHFKTVAFCEIDAFCQKVLKKHWPDVPIYEDVRTLDYGRLKADGIDRINVITGGFPCQDLSTAGKQRGINAERSGLWAEIVRLAGEIRPHYVIVENVSNLLSGPSEQRGTWFGVVLGDLAQIGYDAEWHCIPASYVGAKHHRDRAWIMAYPQQKQRTFTVQSTNDGETGSRSNETVGMQDGVRFKMGSALRSVPNRWMDQPNPDRMVNGISDWSHRLGAIGNAVVPQIPEIIGQAIIDADNE